MHGCSSVRVVCVHEAYTHHLKPFLFVFHGQLLNYTGPSHQTEGVYSNPVGPPTHLAKESWLDRAIHRQPNGVWRVMPNWEPLGFADDGDLAHLRCKVCLVLLGTTWHKHNGAPHAIPTIHQDCGPPETQAQDGRLRSAHIEAYDPVLQSLASRQYSQVSKLSFFQGVDGLVNRVGWS